MLPAFQPGDSVEYGVVCRCLDRQAPSPDDLRHLPSTFRVLGAALPGADGPASGPTPQGLADRVGPQASPSDAEADQSQVISGPIGMNLYRLRQLRDAKGLTIEALQAKVPDLADEVIALVRREDAARLIASLDLPEQVRLQVAEIDVTGSTDDVAEQLRGRLVELGVDDVQVEQLAQHARNVTLGLQPGQAIATHPAVASQIAIAQVNEVSTLAGLGSAAAAALTQVASAPSAVDEASLTKLVAEKQLTEMEAQQVGFSAALYQLVHEDTELAMAIRSASFGRLAGQSPTSTADLAKLTVADWSSFLSSSKTLPNGTTADGMARTLAARFAAVHPSVAFVARLPDGNADEVGRDLHDLGPLFTQNPKVVSVSFDALDATGLSTQQIAALQQTQLRLVQLSQAYPGLQLASVLDDPELTLKAKAETVARRTGLVEQVSEQLGETEAFQLDLSVGSPDLTKLGLGQLGASNEEQQMVVSTFQAYQRAWAASGGVEDAHALVQHGFTSALSMGRLNVGEFQVQSGLDPARAKTIWDVARTSLADVTMTAGSIIDILQGLFRQLRVSNQPPSIEDYLKKLPGFQDLFGNLSFCDCEECRSILGPAAYFVDLMKYIDENLRNQFAGHPNHPLDLKTRRPDLWTLELSCANTNTRIATLDIINEVLENYIAQRLGYHGSLADRITIGALVYKQTLAQLVDSINQPFHLPLARVVSYLTELGHTRTEVAGALAASATVRVQAELDLSPRERQLLTTPDADLGHLSHLYGVTFGGSASAVAAVDAQLLGRALGLPRQELGELIATDFVAGGGARVTITAAKSSSGSVQNDIELVNGLTADALDRMHRYVRLVGKAGWTIPDLDLVLATLGETTLGQSGVEAIAELHAVQAQFGITVPELCALVGALPQAPGGTSLLDRLFNPPSYVAADGAFPNPAAHFVHPAFRHATPAPVDPALPRLLTGLSVDLDGLAALARHLATHLAQESSTGFDPNAANDDDRYFVLSAPNLTLLYRHARLARLLSVSIDDLFELLGFLGLDHVEARSDLLALLDLHKWWRHSGYRLDDIAVATGQPPRDPGRYPDAATVAAQVVAAAATALTFTDTVFAVSLGTAEQGSRDLIAENLTVIEPATDGTWRLAAGIDLDGVSIAVPSTATVPTPPVGSRLVTAAEVRQALRPYLAAEVLARALGSALSFATDKVVALAAIAQQSLTDGTVVKAVRGNGPIDPLTALVSAVRPLAVAFAHPAWDPAALTFARQHQALFDAENLPHMAPDAAHPTVPFLSLPQLRALSTYARLAQPRPAATPDAPTVNPEDIRSVLTAFDAGIPGFPSSSDAAMARALNAPSGLVVGLRGRVTLPAVAAPALDQLDRAAQLASALGVDGETFGALVSDDYDLLSHAADALVAVLGTRHADETTRAARLDEAEEPVHEAKREALAGYLISITPKVWNTLDDLYQYFLIDVEAGGCSTTSRVVAATMTAQLYVHRAIMSLEQDNLPATDPHHVALRMPADAAAEWEWRKNFRVWQANRQVFLWPENYLEPDLRDDKTPLFSELEQELLQTDITDQNVLDAYTKYLTGLEEVASLTIAGAYHDVISPRHGFSYLAGREQVALLAVSGSYQDVISSRYGFPGQVGDVLHLFGATATDPPTYYYRTCENLIASGRDPNAAAVWSPWQKITVQITARRVAPVVHKGRLHMFWTDIKTRSINSVQSGSSQFSGYQHKMTLKFTTLRPDGAWTAPQEVELPGATFGNFGPARGQIMDWLIADQAGKYAMYDPQRRHTREAIEDYTLLGPNWEGVWPRSWSDSRGVGLEIQFRNFIQRTQVDLFGRRIFDLPGLHPWSPDPVPPYPQLLCAKTAAPSKPLYYGTPTWMLWPNPAFANAIIDEQRLDAIAIAPGFKSSVQGGLYVEQIATIPADTQLLAVPGSAEDGLLQVGNDVLLLQGSITNDSGYVLRRLGTTLIEEIARRLFEDGLDELLDFQTQRSLAEAGLPITPTGSRIHNRSNTGQLDFKGPYGVYYRELFFHIPFLIANALNSRGRFAAAQRWYHYIFDPTATEVVDVIGLPPGEVAHRLLDRVWRYREFRGLDVVRLRDILTDQAAIALYRKDPFNPWAIARRRISAFQKAIVMKYVDNLLDWADSLFTQFTMEAVNEALMLYITASDVLGPRPQQLGDCGTGVEPNTYEHIAPLVGKASEILIQLETWTIGARAWNLLPVRDIQKYIIPYKAIAHAVERNPLIAPVEQATSAVAVSAPPATAVGPPAGSSEILVTGTQPAVAVRDTPAGAGNLFSGLGWNATRTASWGPALANASIKTVDKLGGRTFDHASKRDFSSWAGGFGWHFIRQLTPVFCVPANTDLLAYWDRVEDRLYKIRHCMDIDGQRRELALFAPPISPMQLVAMKAAGLSLDDVLGTTSGNLPPYRFLYLIDRAKAFAATLSGFGASLLSALEKKDAEQLNRLRLTQQMNLARLTTRIQQLEIQAASESLEALNRQRDAAQYRSDFYAGLVSTDRNGWEIAESATRHLVSGIHLIESGLDLGAAIAALEPQVGSPFAMKYGGVELSGSLAGFGNMISAIAEASEAVSASVSLEGNFARRSEGWANQKALADYDVRSLDRQIRAASLRVEIANHSLTLHQRSIDQLQEVLDLTDGRFTNLGLYTWLSAQLQRLYRGAYQNALALAKLAEQAYRFERGDDTSPALITPHWDLMHAGLLSGEQLLIDLQTLERRYLETNYRTLEVDQAFALSQIDAHALIDLRETGECTFMVSEAYFDLFYPGHYKRRIKAVRLTIPSITGPYVNVSATLNLQNSWIRPTAALGAPLVEVPPSRSVSIATSTAQNDAGVFELSFRDERYMPFEGLGAISEWHLTLPKVFPQFDYQTINDVILSISYTAEQDGALRERVEAQNKALEGSIMNYFSVNPARRLLSLRQDFSSAFTRLLLSPAKTQVNIELTERNFPLFARGRTIQVQRGILLVRTAPGSTPTGLKLMVDGTLVEGFTSDPSLGNVPGKLLPATFTGNLRAKHTFTVETAGELAPSAASLGDASVADPTKLLDVLLYLEYLLS
jgi:hypothetical protein